MEGDPLVPQRKGCNRLGEADGKSGEEVVGGLRVREFGEEEMTVKGEFKKDIFLRGERGKLGIREEKKRRKGRKRRKRRKGRKGRRKQTKE